MFEYGEFIRKSKGYYRKYLRKSEKMIDFFICRVYTIFGVE